MTITTDRMSPRMIVEGIGTHDDIKASFNLHNSSLCQDGPPN